VVVVFFAILETVACCFLTDITKYNSRAKPPNRAIIPVATIPIPFAKYWVNGGFSNLGL
jgi:hypothetical protein